MHFPKQPPAHCTSTQITPAVQIFLSDKNITVHREACSEQNEECPDLYNEMIPWVQYSTSTTASWMYATHSVKNRCTQPWWRSECCGSEGSAADYSQRVQWRHLGAASGQQCRPVTPTCESCTHARTHTHTHPFNGPFSGTTWVSRYHGQLWWANASTGSLPF